jgi:hypothetical protein
LAGLTVVKVAPSDAGTELAVDIEAVGIFQLDICHVKSFLVRRFEERLGCWLAR